MKIVECVPNISEGRRRDVFEKIAQAAEVSGVRLLDIDPGQETNRTVVTFVGDPDAVLEGAFQLVKKSFELIDMREHHGAHARMGATDVCPLVPVSGVTMDDCVELAHRLGRRVGEEIGVPVYLYEHAATRPERRSLADIRQGEYEALPNKLRDPSFAPDYGPAEFVPSFGAVVVGARKFLVAYNVNLNVTD
jgi:glutamate formiminotransferase/formiminotetrahydrofolate cyclodeaminase